MFNIGIAYRRNGFNQIVLFLEIPSPPPYCIQYTLYSLLYFMFVLLTSMHHLYPSCISAMLSFFAFPSERTDKKFQILFCCLELIVQFIKEFATECGWDHLYIWDGDSVFSDLQVG